MTEAAVYEFLSRERLGVLGTIGADGRPQSALVGIAVTPKLEIVFDTVRSTRKYPNLVARSACSFVIGGWKVVEKTVQYEGIAQELAGTDKQTYLDTYFEAWPDGVERLKWEGIVHFVVRPTWLRYSDYDQTPALIREFRFGSDILGEGGSPQRT